MDMRSYLPEDAKDMTLRDYFAAKAMQALLQQLGQNPFQSGETIAQRAAMIPKAAFQVADLMIKERGHFT